MPIVLALSAAPALAAPIVTQIGGAHVTVVLSPDPPQLGSNSVTVTITGASPSALAQTSVQYTTAMPSMSMSGPSGRATRIASRANAWRFDVPFTTATQWTLRVELSGALNGTVNAPFTIRDASQSTGSISSMAGMGASSGDANAWRLATFALLAVILIGAFVLARDRRPTTIAMVIIAALVVLGIAVIQSRYGSDTSSMTSMDANGSAPIPVTLAPIGRDPGYSTLSAPANVAPYLVQNIIARAPGVITNFSAYTGDRLYAGQVVARLSEPDLQSNAQAAQAAAQAAISQGVSAQQETVSMRASLAAASANARYWNTEIARERTLLSEGAVSVQEYQNERARAAAATSDENAARARLAAAAATAQGAQAQVAQAGANAQTQNVLAGYTRVVVPDDAVVIKRLVDPGVYVQAGTPLLQVAVVDRLRVDAQISQQALAAVQVGTPMDVYVENGKVLHTRVTSVSPVVDPTTHLAIAEAIVQNTNNALQPGGFVHVLLHAHMAVAHDSYSVPSGAIVGGATTAIWTDLHGTAHRVSVTVLSDDGTTAQISGNLRVGMQVVVTGAADLLEGQPIASAR